MHRKMLFHVVMAAALLTAQKIRAETPFCNSRCAMNWRVP